jgi:hypothetical protein
MEESILTGKSANTGESTAGSDLASKKEMDQVVQFTVHLADLEVTKDPATQGTCSTCAQSV